jgi:hypothetical protein
MYRELDIVKKPKSKNEIDTSKKKDLTAEEKAAAEEAEAKALAEDKIVADTTLCDHSVSARLTVADYKQIIDSSIRVANFYRALLKQKKVGCRLSLPPSAQDARAASAKRKVQNDSVHRSTRLLRNRPEEQRGSK